jgi:2-polyprenyl-3-methyl-5-hydroxy-6-metoxy-1,4-benzoquinol methylase
MKTEDIAYTDRLSNQVWWKNIVDVQWPYRRHLRSLELGRVLEVGCGVGRNLINLGMEGNVGIDHNSASVQVAQGRGLIAFTPDEFLVSNYAITGFFDSLLVAHVFEHLTTDDAKQLIAQYIRYVANNGRIVIVTPQQAGFASDPTHLTKMNHELVRDILHAVGVRALTQYSFPFPEWVGRFFIYNENISVGQLS